jgi:hypothetical protein
LPARSGRSSSGNYREFAPGAAASSVLTGQKYVPILFSRQEQYEHWDRLADTGCSCDPAAGNAKRLRASQQTALPGYLDMVVKSEAPKIQVQRPAPGPGAQVKVLGVRIKAAWSQCDALIRGFLRAELPLRQVVRNSSRGDIDMGDPIPVPEPEPYPPLPDEPPIPDPEPGPIRPLTEPPLIEVPDARPLFESR